MNELEKSKKFYLKVIEVAESKALNTASSLNAKENKLLKLTLETEDEEIKALLRVYIAEFREYSRLVLNRMIQHASKQARERMVPAKNTLLNIINKRLESGKPEWQTIAELNGWRKVY